VTAVLVCSIVLFVIVGLAAANHLMRRVRHGAAEHLAQLSGQPDVVRTSGANCFGIHSKGKWQNRGNGTLILTAERLVFEPVVGNNRVDQRRDAITKVDTVRSFLGKSIFRDLLHVEWRSDTGTDSAAWFVKDLDGWLAALRK
jgi:hypothetical protein